MFSKKKKRKKHFQTDGGEPPNKRIKLDEKDIPVSKIEGAGALAIVRNADVSHIRVMESVEGEKENGRYHILITATTLNIVCHELDLMFCDSEVVFKLSGGGVPTLVCVLF